MIKILDSKDLPVAINGMQKIRVGDENIDLGEYVGSHAIPKIIPKQVCFSKKIGGTIYDVTASFDMNGKHSILEQFKKLLLSQE